MFGRNKTIERLQKVEERIEHNSQILEEDHADLVELKTQITSLIAENQELRSRIEALEERQQNFRQKLVSAIDLPPLALPPLEEVPYTGHVCVNKDGQPSTTATCVECNKRRVIGDE